MPSCTRILIDQPPFDTPPYTRERSWAATGAWPCTWILPPAEWQSPWMGLFRCPFHLDKPLSTRIHVSADERYELFIDGSFTGRGNDRGDRSNWYYDTYELTLEAGKHTLLARVWSLGVAGLAPWAQMSVQPGFLFVPEDPSLLELAGTGRGTWEARLIQGCAFEDMSKAAGTAMGVGPSEHIDGFAYPWGWESGTGENWQPVRKGPGAQHGYYFLSTRPYHWLRPSTLPTPASTPWTSFAIVRIEGDSILDEAFWLSFLQGKATLEIPAHTRQKVVIHLDNYLCAYPSFHWSGGKDSRITLGWVESLKDPATKDKVRSAPKNGLFGGPHDSILCDGGKDRHWRAHWWRCGTVIEISVETADEPLLLQQFLLEETRYPIDPTGRWQVEDPSLDAVFAGCLRTLQMCMHETYVDCPYYEQLMYVGDTRLQALLTYALTDDDRLPRKAIDIYDSSRLNPSGIVTASHPSGGGQLIPPFALWWISMVHDYALWRGDREFIRGRLPGVRAVLDQFLFHVDEDGALHGLTGWNYLDWPFPGGVPQGGLPGELNSCFQGQWFMALESAAFLEEFAGDPEMAARWNRLKSSAGKAWRDLFWDLHSGRMADDLQKSSFSEHAQCLALLAGILPPEQQQQAWQAIGKGEGLVKTSSYFSHYLFEASLRHNREGVFFERLSEWKTCVVEGFKTTPEGFGQARSDCHAWAAHPLYHYLTGVLGIFPAAPGFTKVSITPHLGPLEKAAGSVAHPQGDIHVSLSKTHGQLSADIDLPGNLTGVFSHGGQQHNLKPGRQTITISL